MEIKIDFRSERPIYVQIVEQIQMMIANGEIHPGDQLPTVRQLATDLRVNFNTVARAYRLLDEAGLISTQHGRGTYVWKAPSEESIIILRKQNLQAQVQQCIHELVRLGYSLPEISEEISKILTIEQERSI
jgi:GntR family transcriptional regulator